MENIVASGQIKVYEAAQLWNLYILNFKLGICILQTNVINFAEEKQSHK